MADDAKRKEGEPADAVAKERRDFLRKAGMTAAAAPAATLLLSAKAKRAQANDISGVIFDDADDN